MSTLPPTQRATLSTTQGTTAIVGQHHAQFDTSTGAGILQADCAAAQPSSYANTLTRIGSALVQAPQDPQGLGLSLWAWVTVTSLESALVAAVNGDAESHCQLDMEVEEFSANGSTLLATHSGSRAQVYERVVGPFGQDARQALTGHYQLTIPVSSVPGNLYRLWINSRQSVRAHGLLARGVSSFRFDFTNFNYVFVPISK